ncbi:MAG TPA: type II CAAX endopeptidase family protein [Pyrinomonadaceae bacterium]|nr:type II CAAX endopeptidase family protein [Pyrinomonadaceae bacterium]
MQNEELKTTEYNAPLVRDLAELKPEPEIITPNNPPWNGWIAFGVWVLSVLAIIVFPIFFIVPYVLMNKEISLETFATDSTAIFLNLVAIVPAHLFTLAVAWFVATKNNKFSIKDTLGLSSGGFRWWYYPVILICFFAAAAGVSHFIPEGDNDLLRILRSSRMAVFAIVILATFTAPLVEEVVYRGILYSAFQRRVGVAWAVVIVTLMFAAVHVPQYWGSPGTILLICLLSLVLTLIRVKTDNLLPCIIMHTIFNGIQSLLLIAEPYLPKAESTVQEQAALIIRFFT